MLKKEYADIQTVINEFCTPAEALQMVNENLTMMRSMVKNVPSENLVPLAVLYYVERKDHESGTLIVKTQMGGFVGQISPGDALQALALTAVNEYKKVIGVGTITESWMVKVDRNEESCDEKLQDLQAVNFKASQSEHREEVIALSCLWVNGNGAFAAAKIHRDEANHICLGTGEDDLIPDKGYSIMEQLANPDVQSNIVRDRYLIGFFRSYSHFGTQKMLAAKKGREKHDS